MMTRALDVNDNTEQNPKRAPPSGDKPRKQKVEGKSLQVNENRVEDQQPAPAPER